MPTFAFRFPQLAYDSYSREPATWREDGRLLDVDGKVVPTTDLNGVPGPLRTGATGIVAPFKADIDAGTAVFGESSATLVVSDEWIVLRDRIDDLVASANKAVGDANAALRKAVPISWIGRDPDGRVFVNKTPVEVDGGAPVWEGGRLYFVFPTTLTP